MNILLVGKSSKSFTNLKSILVQGGHRVLICHREDEALSRLHENPNYRLAIIDYSIDDSGGIGFCRRIKSSDFNRYIFVMLIRKNDPDADVQDCLDFGIDDCMTRPLRSGELLVRIQAGIKVIQLHENLGDARRLMGIDSKSPAEIRYSLIPVNIPHIADMEIAARFIPSALVSGDIYNIFRLDENHIGLFSIDVSGHGIPAALFSVGLSQRLSHDLHPRGLLKIPKKTSPYYRVNSPEKVVAALDEDDLLAKYGRYFTMVYAVINLPQSKVTFCRAGHNLPLIIHDDGSSEYIDGGGPPVGLGLRFQNRYRQELTLEEGDAFITFSDGINETFSRRGKNGYGLRRVKDLLSSYHSEPLDIAFDKLIQDAKTYRGSETFADDISIIGFRWRKKLSRT